MPASTADFLAGDFIAQASRCRVPRVIAALTVVCADESCGVPQDRLPHDSGAVALLSERGARQRDQHVARSLGGWLAAGARLVAGGWRLAAATPTNPKQLNPNHLNQPNPKQ